MGIRFQHRKIRLPGAGPFLMLRMAVADCSTGKVAKALAEVRMCLGDTFDPPLSRRSARRSSLKRGAVWASLSAFRPIQMSAALGALRRAFSTQNSRLAPISRLPGDNRLAPRTGERVCVRQNGRCRNVLPPRWGERSKGPPSGRKPGVGLSPWGQRPFPAGEEKHHEGSCESR